MTFDRWLHMKYFTLRRMFPLAFFIFNLAYWLGYLYVFWGSKCCICVFVYVYLCQRWAVTLARVLITGIPFQFVSLNTGLDIKTVILKVSIPVSISRLKIWKSWFQSQVKDTSFKSLDSSLNIKTQVSKVSIPASISRLFHLLREGDN